MRTVMASPLLMMVPGVPGKRRWRVSGVAAWLPGPGRARKAASRAWARTASMMPGSTLRLTVGDSASVQNAWMISARRCPVVMRRAYWPVSALGGDVTVAGDDHGRRVASRAGDDQLADGARVAGQFHGGGLRDPGLVVAAGPVHGDGREVLGGQGADLSHQGG